MEKNEKVYNPEEEVPVGNWKIVDLKKQDTDNKETDEQLFTARTKIYWWKENQWKERGVGNLKIIKNKESKKVKCVHIQEQTFKIRAHFYIYGKGMCELEVMKTAKNSYLWSCIDFSEDLTKPSVEKFGVRFKTEEEFNLFKKIWEDSLEKNSKLDWGQKSIKDVNDKNKTLDNENLKKQIKEKNKTEEENQVTEVVKTVL